MAEIRTVLENIRGGQKVRSIVRDRRIRFLGLLLAVIILLAMVIAWLEQPLNEPFESPIDVFYWAVVTISTVGYGDITVHHIVSKVLAAALILAGVILVSLMTATFASIFTATRIREGMGLKKIELHNHVVICGYNASIAAVVKSIIDAAERIVPDIVLVNSHQESDFTDLNERFPEAPIRFVYGDYTIESTLLRAGIRDAAAAIVLADTGPDHSQKPDERTLLATLTIKSVAKDLEVCAEVLDATSVPHLVRAGVDQTVVAGEFSGFFLANAVMSPGIPQAFREIINIKNGSDIRREFMPRDYIGKPFSEAAISFLERDGSILIGVITERKSFNLENVLSGETGDIDTFIRRKFEEAGRSLEIESKGRLNVNINPGKDYLITEDDYAVILTPKQVEA